MIRLSRAMWWRVYGDFAMPSRLRAYRKLLQAFLAAGYAGVTVKTMLEIARGERPPPRRGLVIRHDVDSDVATARHMFEIEAGLGFFSSFFFRLRTWDPHLAKSVAGAGGEPGYHFEEIATFAKRRGLTCREEVAAHLPAVQELFRKNLTSLRVASGLPLAIVASHGDYMNRRLGMMNYELLDDALRRQMGILAETYDRELAELPTQRVSDCGPPNQWRGCAPIIEPYDADETRPSLVYVLIHPKHWYARWSANTSEMLARLRDEACYHLALRGRA